MVDPRVTSDHGNPPGSPCWTTMRTSCLSVQLRDGCCCRSWIQKNGYAPYEQGSKDAMKGFNYDRSSLLKICDLLCVAIGGLM